MSESLSCAFVLHMCTFSCPSACVGVFCRWRAAFSVPCCVQLHVWASVFGFRGAYLHLFLSIRMLMRGSVRLVLSLPTYTFFLSIHVLFLLPLWRSACNPLHCVPSCGAYDRCLCWRGDLSCKVFATPRTLSSCRTLNSYQLVFDSRLKPATQVLQVVVALREDGFLAGTAACSDRGEWNIPPHANLPVSPPPPVYWAFFWDDIKTEVGIRSIDFLFFWV